MAGEFPFPSIQMGQNSSSITVFKIKFCMMLKKPHKSQLPLHCVVVSVTPRFTKEDGGGSSLPSPPCSV